MFTMVTELEGPFGGEYPAAVMVNGIRLPLHRESRFSRHYWSAQHRLGCEVSRFRDGSASITAAELQREWPSYTDEERTDFCQSARCLESQPDFPDVLRFVMQHGGPEQWSAVATLVASGLPRDEAFDLLVRALRSTEMDSPSNVVQGIAETQHPDARATLSHHLQGLWQHPTLWEDAEPFNGPASMATACIGLLIELGAPPADFTEQVRQLAKHVCSRNRDWCRSELTRYYPWLRREG